MNHHLRWKIEDMNERQRKTIVKDRVADPAPHLEPHTRNALLEQETIKRFNRPVNIVLRSFRHRLTDAAGLCEKYVIDALVSAGVFIDDRQEYVKEITQKQIKIGKGEEEKTIIEIYEAI